MEISDVAEYLAAIRRDIIEDVVTFARRKRQLEVLLGDTDEMRSNVDVILEVLRSGGREQLA
jgi:hypothetical protein